MSNDKFVVEDVPDGDNSVAFISQVSTVQSLYNMSHYNTITIWITML